VQHLGLSGSAGPRAVSVTASARVSPMEFGTLSIIRSMRPAMIYVPDTAP
jgi:hypothetical protein